MRWLFFGIGLMTGGMLGVTLMCLCAVSGRASETENRMNADDPVREDNKV